MVRIKISKLNTILSTISPILYYIVDSCVLPYGGSHVTDRLNLIPVTFLFSLPWIAFLFGCYIASPLVFSSRYLSNERVLFRISFSPSPLKNRRPTRSCITCNCHDAVPLPATIMLPCKSPQRD